MLKYSVKPSSGSVLTEFPVKEIYVSPDLSFISGVTSYNVGLVDGEKIVIKSPYLIGNDENTLNVVNVKRQGRVKVEINLPVKTINTNLIFPIVGDSIIIYNSKQKLTDEELETTGYTITRGVSENFIEYKGDISYYFHGYDELSSGYLIDHKFYSSNGAEKYIKINTYVYIEDGELHIGDNVYHVDFTETEEDGTLKKPKLKLDKSSRYVCEGNGNLVLGYLNGYECTAVTEDDGSVVIVDYKANKWERVSKFIIQKEPNPRLDVEDVLYGGYRNFVEFNNENYYAFSKYDYETNEYVGYGVQINDVFYTVKSVDDHLKELYEKNHDLPYIESGVYVEETDEYLDVENSLVNQQNIGKFILLIDSNENDDIQVGNYILAESQTPISIDRYLECEGETGEGDEYNCVNYYITFQGKKYYVEDRLYDTVELSGSKYVLNYLDEYKTSASTVVNGEKLFFNIGDLISIFDEETEEYVDYDISYDENRNAKVEIDGVEKNVTINGEEVSIEGETDTYELLHNATLSYKVYYKAEKEEDEEEIDYGTDIKFGINETPYNVSTASGVMVNGNKYEVLVSDMPLGDDEEEYNERTNRYVTIVENLKFLYEVKEIDGSSTYLLYPVIDNDTIDEIEEDSLQREINSIVKENWKSFAFYVKKDTFGSHELTVDNGLMAAMEASTPYTASDSYLLEREIEILRVNNYLSFKFPISTIGANNLTRNDVLQSDFIDSLKENTINEIVDMEKDVYYPMWVENGLFRPIEQIRFNLHFRNRTLGNWRIIEDDREYMNNRVLPNCNWFVTDNFYYTSQGITASNNLQNSSDLLGYLNFSTDDIKYQASRLGKSFLRLSYYTSTDPKDQVLLYTSTVFFDESGTYRKYLNSKRNSDLTYIDTNKVQRGYESGGTRGTWNGDEFTPSDDGQDIAIKVGEDYFTPADFTEKLCSSSTISNFTELNGDEYFNDESRLSSRFIIENKYMTNTSSEGFYLYMFKDYSKKTRVATIYMKVEFNHAGIGKTIQFMLPRHTVTIEEEQHDVPLYVHNEQDVEILRQGFPMQDIYKQIYIPINIVYDEESNKYVYYLPDELRENEELNVDNEIMEFNLFEVKFANESMVDQNEDNSY